ncbi:MAG: 1,4-alpha-glucan branching protein domain-containing protein [Tepidiformaceae bacterium]
MPGNATIVLHTHLPYCRLAGRWPHGEEWLHEAMLECYLPLLAAFRRLSGEVPGELGVTINMTPILAEQIADPLIRQHFRTYLADKITRARTDLARFDGAKGLLAKTARFHLERFEAAQAFFEDEIGANPLRALAELEEGGHIEIASSAATHGYLPLLHDEAAVRFQVETGVGSHLRNFGRKPRSFWLPECAYKPGLERFLEDAGIKVFFVETHLVTGGAARGKAAGGMVGPYPEVAPAAPVRPVRAEPHLGTTFRPYFVGSSQVSVLARNERTGLQVWSAANGYPGDSAYREFHRKDVVSGLHYWRVTSPEAELGEKAEYDPEVASRRAVQHAQHFRELVGAELSAYQNGTFESGHQDRGSVVASYDTELFGHWWMEGVEWLEQVLRNLAADPDVNLISAGRLVERQPPTESIVLPEGSWGAGGDHRTWQNEETAWTWPEIYERQARAATLLGVTTAATQQLARELLLLQASDWQFLMTTGQANDYAIERFNSHARRFDALAEAIETESPGLSALLDEYQWLDNPFPNIAPALYAVPPATVDANR